MKKSLRARVQDEGRRPMLKSQNSQESNTFKVGVVISVLKTRTTASARSRRLKRSTLVMVVVWSDFPMFIYEEDD